MNLCALEIKLKVSEINHFIAELSGKLDKCQLLRVALSHKINQKSIKFP